MVAVHVALASAVLEAMVLALLASAVLFASWRRLRHAARRTADGRVRVARYLSERAGTLGADGGGLLAAFVRGAGEAFASGRERETATWDELIAALASGDAPAATPTADPEGAPTPQDGDAAALRAALEEKESVIQDMRAKVTELLPEATAAKRVRATLQETEARVNELQGQLRASEQRATHLQRQVEELEATSSGNNEALVETTKKLRHELAEKTKRCAALEAECKSLEREYLALFEQFRS